MDTAQSPAYRPPVSVSSRAACWSGWPEVFNSCHAAKIGRRSCSRIATGATSRSATLNSSLRRIAYLVGVAPRRLVDQLESLGFVLADKGQAFRSVSFFALPRDSPVSRRSEDWRCAADLACRNRIQALNGVSGGKGPVARAAEAAVSGEVRQLLTPPWQSTRRSRFGSQRTSSDASAEGYSPSCCDSR